VSWINDIAQAKGQIEAHPEVVAQPIVVDHPEGR
jgi:hypothetical protein